MGRKLVLLNGPAGCGKDTVGNIIRWHFNKKSAPEPFGYETGDPCECISPADYLKDVTHELFGLACDTYKYEKMKNLLHSDFQTKHMGILSPRKAYIHVSENIMKPMFGEHVFSERLVSRIERMFKNAPLIVNTSLGFAAEAAYLRAYYGADNLLLIRIKRPGCTFDGDSRRYVYTPADIQQHEIYNDKTSNYLQDLSDKILPLVRAFYNA